MIESAVLRIVFTLVLAIAISGCDVIYGVTRTETFVKNPSPECVQRITRSMDGVTELRYSEAENPYPTMAQGIELHGVIHRYWYVYQGIENSFWFDEKYGGSTTFYHGYRCMNCQPSQENLDVLYPFIRKLEEAIDTECGADRIGPPRETCYGVECPSAINLPTTDKTAAYPRSPST